MKIITGTWQDAAGNPVANGRVLFRLSQDAVAVGTGQIVPSLVSITLNSSGQIPTNTQIWANDELTPSGTVYITSVLAAGGGLVWGAESLSITGSPPVNLNNAVPTSQNVSILNPVVQNPQAPQTITGFGLTLTSSAPLTVQGNEVVGGTLTVSGVLSVPTIQGPGFQKQIFTSSGTFTIPTGVTQVKVTVIGGGGGGGGGTAAATPGNGGGSGGAAIKWLTGLTPGNTLSVTIGSGGAGVSGGTAANGTGSTVSSGTQSITSIITNGGLGAAPFGSGNAGGATAGTGGDFNFGGTDGQQAAANTVSGCGGPSLFGGGGSSTAGNLTGGAGRAPGAGGGGGGGTSGNTTGGAGAAGIVIFGWIS